MTMNVKDQESAARRLASTLSGALIANVDETQF